MTTLPPDAIDAIASVTPELDAVRRRRPDVRTYAQQSFDALFSPVDDAEFAVADRWLVAAFATRLTAADAAADFYAEQARSADVRADRVLAEAERVATSGPFGHYAEPGLQGENTDGLRYEPDADLVAAVGVKLAAALEHAHLLTYRLRETSGESHDRLLAAGWSVDGIVTLSQLLSFLAFQQRVAAGLRVLGEVAA